MGYTGEQKREYGRTWIANRRQSWIQSQGGKCTQCGSKEKLEIDHINRTLKTMAAAAIWSRSEQIRNQELLNCQVLCNTCHKAKTKKEKSGSDHGSHSKYVQGCRCLDCTIAHRDRARLSRSQGKPW